jgi:hypothetical protein
MAVMKNFYNLLIKVHGNNATVHQGEGIIGKCKNSTPVISAIYTLSRLFQG